MRTDNKKAVSTTLTAFQNSQTQSNHNMALSNKKAPCLEPSIITNRLVLLLAGGYSESTTLNHVVKFDDLNNSKRRTNALKPITGVFLCLSFNGGRAWDTVRCAGFLLRQFVNLRTATALNYLTMISGSFFKLAKGTIAMSINTPVTPSSEVRYV